MANIEVKHSVEEETEGPGGWALLFQWGTWRYDNGGEDDGYRFIWRKPLSEGGGLQPARGQARLPSVEVMLRLIEKAKAEGWGDLKAADAPVYNG